MLPFLKPKTVAGLIISKRKPDGGTEPTESEGNEDQGLISAADDLVRAITSKDSQGVADALKAAFTMLQSRPDESEDFESQNEKAALDQE